MDIPGEPTGIDWSTWNFLNRDILKAVEANTAETVVHQILHDMKNERPGIVVSDGRVSLAFTLIEGDDVWGVFDFDNFRIDEDLMPDDAAAIIAALNRLIDRCTETAQL